MEEENKDHEEIVNESEQDAEEKGAFTINRTNKQVTLYYVWVLVIAYLFVGESFGLNALIVSIITIPIYANLNTQNLKEPKWWIAATIFLLCGIGVYVDNTTTAITAWIFSFMYLFVVTNFLKFSIHLGILQAFISTLNGYASFFEALSNFFRKKSEKKKRTYINIIKIVVPLTLGLIFIKLYQKADKNFHDMTWFINLDWFSWKFVLWYIVIIFILFGTYFGVISNIIREWELKSKDDVSEGHSDRIHQWLGTENEAKIAVSTLLLLNFILLLYVFTDFGYIFGGRVDPLTDPNLNASLHASVKALLGSIVLVILLVTFFLRGQLNFYKNKRVQQLTIGWLSLNILLVFTTSIKNFYYIEHFGLTYKRIGVYVYLTLCLVGLILTIIKTLKKKSFWFLLKNTGIAFALVLSTLLTFNWKRTIADFNLNNIKHQHIDFNYLVNMGPDTYAQIIAYHENRQEVDKRILKIIRTETPKYLEKLQEKDTHTSWKSHCLSEQQILDELKEIKANYKSENWLFDLF